MDKISIGRRIKERRHMLQMTLHDVAENVGVAISTIQRYESGTIEKMKLPVVEAIARALRVNTAWLIGKSNEMELQMERPPFLTEDVVGLTIGEATEEEITDAVLQHTTLEVPRSYLQGLDAEEYFVLEVRGVEMYPLYQAGDKLIIHRQTTLKRSGDVGVVTYDKKPPALYRIDFDDTGKWLRLSPINPNYPATVLEGESLNHCRILGVPRLLLRELP